MGSSDRLFNRHRSLHQILGGGLVADVMLWRRKNVTVGILVVTFAAWVVFEISAYTLLSLVSSVFLLLFTILFLWAKSAAILNRPAPPLPHLHLSEETVNEAATLIRDHVNAVLSVSEDIACGRDSKMFTKVALALLIVSILGSLADFFTLSYICKFKQHHPKYHTHLCSTLVPSLFIFICFPGGLATVLIVPAVYERYEDDIERRGAIWYSKLQQLYARFDEECVSKVHNWILEKKKLS